MAEKNRVSVCASLISAILDSNRELLIELQFTNAIKRYQKEHPVLGQLSISDDLSIDASQLPDSDESVRAIAALIKGARSIMEIFIGLEEAEDAIIKPARRFQEENEDEISEYDLASFFPDLFAFAGSIDLEDLRAKRDAEQLAVIFSRLFSAAMKAEGVGKHGIENVLKNLGFIKGLHFTGDGVKLYFIADTDADDALEKVSGALDSLEVPVELIAPEIKKFGSLAEELGITGRLYDGLLSSKTEFGIDVLDDALGNDISKDFIILLRGPKGVVKDMTAIMCAKSGLDSGGEVVYVNSSESVEDIVRRFGLVGVDAGKAMAEKRLVFVDWYSRNVERIQGVDIEGAIVKCSDDLTNVSVALDMAFKMMGNSPSRRAVIDLISPASAVLDFETVLDFLTAMSAKLRSNGCFGLVTLNDGMLDRKELSAMQDNFDGVIQIRRELKKGRVNHEIGVLSFTGMFSADFFPVELDSRGISIGDQVTGRYYHQAFVGAGVERIITGISGLEILTGGGLPKHGTFLVQIPPALFPAEIVTQLALDCLAKENGLIMAVSTTSPSEFIARFHERGIQTPSLMKSNRLRIVDWHSQRNQRIMGVEDRGGVLCASMDIMHLGVAVDLALKQLDYDRDMQAVIDTLSTSLRDYDIKTIYKFAQSMRAKFHKRGITCFMILEKATQDARRLAIMEEVFDGTLDISDVEGQLEIGVLSIKDTHFDINFRPLLKLRSGFAVDITGKVKRTPSSLASASMGGAVSDDVIKSISNELEGMQQDRSLLEQKTAEMEKKESELKDHIQALQARIMQMQSEKVGLEGHRKEVAECLAMLDDLLEGLPEKTIEEFAKSEKFKLYEKILDHYLGDDDENE